MKNINHIKTIYILSLIVVLFLLSIFLFSRYQENKARDNFTGVTHNPDWPKWMNELALKLAKDPKFKSASKPDLSKMALVPKGVAWVGCQNDCRQVNLDPYREVFVNAFYIDINLVTVAEYDVCVKQELCLPPISTIFSKEFNAPDLPVIVDFNRARRYCYWLGKRLPTEMEWEKAARGTDGRLYPWGDDPPDASRGNFCDVNCSMDWADKDYDDGFPKISPVGAFPAGKSPYDLYDMAGNAKQWVTGDTSNTEAEHFAKGSSWYSSRYQMQLHIRQDWVNGIRLDDKSVRCAADANKTPTK